jgi:Holliday junction DNA helicase RuvA
MIALLRGKLIEKNPNQVVLDVGGVGYQVSVPLSTFGALGTLHGEATLLIHTHVREDQLALYGFFTSREKQCFEMLISVSGVGPNLALKILSGMGVEQLAPAIRTGDLVQLVSIPGIGRKIAERIVLELRDKVTALDTGGSGSARPVTKSELESDVGSALVNLGYDARTVGKDGGRGANDRAARVISKRCCGPLCKFLPAEKWTRRRTRRAELRSLGGRD